MFHHCLSISASFPELFFFSYKRIPVRRISLRIKETDSPGYLIQVNHSFQQTGGKIMQNEWRDFNGGAWENEVNVRDFIQRNYKPYDGDSSFLEGPTEDTTALWQDVLELSKQEREAGGVLDMDTKIISTITSHGPAYLDKDKEKIVGFQTDKPFKRSLQPYGGIRMAIKACEDNGYKVDPEVVEYFTTHRKTHNAGVFDAYTPEMRACRSAHIITGLPDAYARGRIIGDYRRPALYGVVPSDRR